MKKLGRFTLFVFLVAMGALMMSIPAQAGTSCHQINAKGVGQDLGGGSTVATIKGGGLLHGTTVGSFVFTGPDSFEGTVTFTTNRATLEVTIAGSLTILSPTSAAFNASGPVTDATGKLAGATGSLTLAGVENLLDGSFTETVTGVVCVDLAP